MLNLPQYHDVEAAARVLAGKAIRTPLIENNVLNEMLGGRIFLKAECLQKTGSFKFRGAYNAVSQLDMKDSDKGVLACSSGNHAQGIAEASRMLGLSSTIIMPADAPKSKKQRTLRSGAKIIEYDRYKQDREELTVQHSKNSGAPIVHPYDNFHVIAGQGTCGLEICQELTELNVELDHMLVCAGGGGLMAGITLAVKHHYEDAKIHPVEPVGYDDQKRSHEAGKRLPHQAKSPSICDAILTPQPGEMSFAICKDQLAQGLVVTDEEALKAVAFAYHELKLVVEPGGAVTLAALLAGKLDVKGKCVACTLSGGNVDPEIFSSALSL